jgi:hypothetical protein
VRLQAGLHLLQMAVSPRSRSRAWMNELRGVVGGLEGLNHSTEADFLAVGGNLMAFLTASRQLHSDIGGLTALVSGEQAQRACHELVLVRDYVQEMQRRSEQGRRILLALQTSATRIHRLFSSLGKIALSFQITAILARIETAHLALSQQDLGNLAVEVRSCSDAIELRANQVLETAAAFHSRVTSALYEVARSNAIQQKELPALLEAVDADLEIFEARQRDTVSASTKLAADLNVVTADLGAIATAIQFHDITRQQVEHVSEALAGLVEHAAGGAISPSGVASIELQQAQLKSAAASFAQSTQAIDRDLEAIAVRVGEMGAASKRVLGLDLHQETSFLSDMERRFAGILRAIGESQSLERSTRATIAELDVLNQRLRTAVAEVQVIELQLSRISINGIVSASHIGARGEPLNVVAGAMQALHIECASRSGDAEVDLDSIGAALLSLTADASNSDDESSAELFENLKTRMGDLRSANVASADSAVAVARVADSLCKNLQEARSHAGIGRVFSETVDRCCDVLGEVAAQAPALWSFAKPVIEETREGNYTMRAERDVHRAAASGLAPLPHHPASGAAVAEGATDDVEFF